MTLRDGELPEMQQKAPLFYHLGCRTPKPVGKWTIVQKMLSALRFCFGEIHGELGQSRHRPQSRSMGCSLLSVSCTKSQSRAYNNSRNCRAHRDAEQLGGMQAKGDGTYDRGDEDAYS